MQSLRERIGPLQAPIGVRAMFAILLALGVATFAIEVRSDPTRAYAAFLLAYWCLFSWYFVRNSIRQDQTGDPKLVRSSTKASAAFILLFALTLTVAGFDLLMSLEPTWYSTIFGVYCFAGVWQSGLAAITI